MLSNFVYFFLELFQFNYDGGSRGLTLNLNFTSKSSRDEFEAFGCRFTIKETEVSEYPFKSVLRQKIKNKLSKLKPCTKYEVKLTIHNPSATRKNFADFVYKNYVFTKIDPQTTKLVLELISSDANSATLKINFANRTIESSCLSEFDVEVKNTANESFPIDISTTQNHLTVKNISICDEYQAEMTTISFWNERVKSNVLKFTLKNDKPKVANLSVTAISPNSVNVSWTQDDSEASKCLSDDHELHVYDNENVLIIRQNVSEGEVITFDTKECTDYSFVLIDFDGKTLAKQFLTTLVQFPLDDVKVAVDGRERVITWPKIDQRACILDFTVTYRIQNCYNDIESCRLITKSIEKDQNTLKLDDISPFEYYELEFIANIADESQSKLIIFNTLDREEFRVTNITHSLVSLQELRITWLFDESNMKFLDHFKLTFDGKIYETSETSFTFPVTSCNKSSYLLIIQCIANDDDSMSGDPGVYLSDLKDDKITQFITSLDGRISHTLIDPKIASISWTPTEDLIPCIQSYDVFVEIEQHFNTEATSFELVVSLCTPYLVEITPILHNGIIAPSTVYAFNNEQTTCE